jgi:hypothetical protein
MGSLDSMGSMGSTRCVPLREALARRVRGPLGHIRAARRVLGLALAASLGGACADKSSEQAADLGVDPSDLSGVAADAGAGGRDLPANPDGAVSAACRGEEAPGRSYKLATRSLLLPTQARGFAVDLDGDGRPDNQLKNLLAVIAAAGLDLQAQIDLAVEAGQTVSLLQLRSTDPATSGCVGVTLGLAQPSGPGAQPRYDGTDTFTVEGKLAPGSGRLTAGRFEMTPPRAQKAADETAVELRLTLSPGSVLTLPLRGAHVEGTFTKSGAVWLLRDGALHGAVSQKDVEQRLVPMIADQVTMLINRDPTSATAQVLIGLFESKTDPASVAKCMVPANCCRTSPGTCKILPAEVSVSAVGTLLAPDIEVLDDAGRWQPSAGGRAYDALSVGLGIEAITAAF